GNPSEYLICVHGPDEWARVLLVFSNELVYRPDDVVGVPEGVLPDLLLLGEGAQPHLDHVHPRRALWGEVELEPGMPSEPPLHVRLRVRPQIVHDHVHVKLLRDTLVYR